MTGGIVKCRKPNRAVIPAKAGIHLRLLPKSKMDSRFRGNDGPASKSLAGTCRYLRHQARY